RWGHYRQANHPPARHSPGARSARREGCPAIPFADQPCMGVRTMPFTNWLRNLRSAVAPGPSPGTHRRQRSLRARTHPLAVEVLEARSLPSTFTVLNLLDSGPDSLRAAVSAANAKPGADAIDFAVTGTVGLTSGELDITDSVTINGPGASALTVSGTYVS